MYRSSIFGRLTLLAREKVHLYHTYCYNMSLGAIELEWRADGWAYTSPSPSDKLVEEKIDGDGVIEKFPKK